MHGEKLRGRLVLVRRDGEKDEDAWMLVHKRDEYAVEGWDPEEHPRSVRARRPLLGGAFATREVHVLWPKRLTRILTDHEGGALDVAATRGVIASGLKPA